MKVIIQTNKIRCDVGNCRNLAKYSVAPEGVGAGQYINLCYDCMRQLYNEMGIVVAPKRSSKKRSGVKAVCHKDSNGQNTQSIATVCNESSEVRDTQCAKEE